MATSIGLLTGFSVPLRLRPHADGIFIGRLVGISDVVGFHADNVRELRAAFEEAVDDYLETCAKIGKMPQKPASGKLMLRVPPEVHRATLIAAESLVPA